MMQSMPLSSPEGFLIDLRQTHAFVRASALCCRVSMPWAYGIERGRVIPDATP